MLSDLRRPVTGPRTDEPDLAAMLRNSARLLVCLAGIFVLSLGVYCGWQVFKHIEAVVTDGQPLESAVDRIANLIDAKSMVIDNPQQGMKGNFGRSVAMAILWLFYVLWMALALGFLKAGGALIAMAFPGKRKK